MTFIVSQGIQELDNFSAEKWWADILTKTFQGRAFREFIAELINYQID